MPLECDTSLSTGSDCVKEGVRVKIQSTYRPGESAPALKQYFFRCGAGNEMRLVCLAL